MKRLLAGTLVALAGLTITASAYATPQTRYFECGGQTPVTNLTAPPLAWSSTQPGSIADGNGCASVDTWVQGASPGNTVYDSIFGGTEAGEVRKLELTVYGLRPFDGALAGPNADITLQVDGEVVAELANVKGDPATKPAPAGSLGATYTFTGLDIPAGGEKEFVISFSSHYTNDPFVVGWGASEVPSGVKLYGYDDLTCTEQQEYDPDLVCDE
jgi:hypothetical protein